MARHFHDTGSTLPDLSGISAEENTLPKPLQAGSAAQSSVGNHSMVVSAADVASISEGDRRKALVDRIICGDSLSVLNYLPTGFAGMVITSPPYYGQRDYDHPDQLGSEEHPHSYIAKLVEIFAHCRRAMKDKGTLWLNLGDKYQEGRLLGMPWRVALALQDDGWRLRSDIIWHKLNAMPSSVKNRFTIDHEYLFMFAKTADYYFNADAVREPHVTFSENTKMMGGRNHLGKRGGTPEKGKNSGNVNLHTGRWDQAFHPKGRNRRTVWRIPLSKSPDPHFAVYPEKLVEPCVLAGSQEGDIVLDPFLGSGTSAGVAQSLARHFIGIDCNPAYCQIAEKRIISSGRRLF